MGPKIDDSEMDTRAASIPLVSNQWNIVPTDDVENGNCQKQSSLYRYNCKGNNQTHFTENPLRLQRLVNKSGAWNDGINKNEKKKRRTLDVFTTMVDTQWRWTIIFFMASFYFSWLFFAFVYWVIAYRHGDFRDSSNQADSGVVSEEMPCLENVRDFTSLFIFSLETQTTIGFGFSRVTENCPSAIVALSLQAILGVVIETFVVGIVFVKLTRAKKTGTTDRF